MTTQLFPILVVIIVSFLFKSTRWIGLVGIAIISYFKPVVTLMVGTIAGMIFCYFKFWRKRAG